MKAIGAIKTYFEKEPHARKVTMKELQALDTDERAELGRLACDELGETFEEKKAA